MIVQLIVEGQGDEAAAPVLLRRLAAAAQAWGVLIARPHRRRRTQLVQRDSLQGAVRVALLRPGCAGVMILFDADDDCPKELAPTLAAWAQEAAGTTPCAVVMANREYEAWLLAGVESLRGTAGIRADAAQHPDPESPRDAKSELESRMRPGFSYSPTVDQASLTASVDLVRAYRSCRSFRKLVAAFGVFLAASGASAAAWPPAEWES